MGGLSGLKAGRTGDKAGACLDPELTFPDWEGMIPEEREGEATIHVDPQVLAKSLETLASMLPAERRAVTMRVAGPTEPVVLTADLGGGREATAVVAPVRKRQ